MVSHVPIWDNPFQPHPSLGGGPSSQQEQSQALCDGCGGSEFNNGDDGFYYCHFCGSQSQHMIDTAMDDEYVVGLDGVGGGAIYNMRQFAKYQNKDQSQPAPKPLTREEILRSLAGSVNACEKEEDKEKRKQYEFEDEVLGPQDFGSEPVLDAVLVVKAISERYAQGMQLMIQLQCEALVEKFGVNPVICGTVGGIWLSFLAATRVFDAGWADQVIEESEELVRKQAGGEKPACRYIRREHKFEPHNMYGRRASFIWLRSLKRAIPLHSSLAISFLACHITRQSVLPSDIVKWAIKADLPYLTAFIDINSLLGKSPSFCVLSSRTLFRPSFVVGAWQLEAMAGLVAQKIGMHLPPVNFYAIAYRYIRELNLPLEKILSPACQIYEWSMPVELCLSSNRLKLPTRAYVMAIIIVTIRILYNINGQGVWEKVLASSSSSPSDDKSGLLCKKDNVKPDDYIKRGFTDNIAPEVTGTVSETPLCSLFHKQNSDFNIQELLVKLQMTANKITDTNDFSSDFSSYLKYCKDVIFAGLTQSYEEDKFKERFCNIYEKQEGKNGKRMKKVTEEHDRNVKKSCVEGQDTFGIHPEDASLSRLIFDMEENGFDYTAPKAQGTPLDCYLHYRRRNSWGKFCYVAHADYYILLRACAKIAEIDCRIMHLAVLYFEKRLAWTEKRITSSLLALNYGSVDVTVNLTKEEVDDLMS